MQSAVEEESRSPGFVMSPIQPEKAPTLSPQRVSMQTCKHARVQIVSRNEDAEFVECVECGEIFESSEFKDMAIEEKTPLEEV
jgi:hypothetical protein